MQETTNRPVLPIRTDRGVGMYILLSIVTFGIYHLVFHYIVGEDVNTIAKKHDNQRTMNYVLAYILGILTFGIFILVWYHGLSNRVGTELNRRGIPNDFSAATFWLWHVLGSLIIVGPWIYTHKLCQAMNALAVDYNAKG